MQESYLRTSQNFTYPRQIYTPTIPPTSTGVPFCHRGASFNVVPDPFKEDSSSGGCNNQQPVVDFRVKLKDGWSVRDYQRELAQPGIEGKNYIIVAPTGSGKTLVSALVISDHLRKYHNQQLSSCHVAFIVSTRPLAEQQKEELAELLPSVTTKMDVYTGDSSGLVSESIRLNNMTVCTAGKLLDEIKTKKIQFDRMQSRHSISTCVQ